MKAGTENRRKTIIAGVGAAVALICIVYIYTQLFAQPENPAAIAMKNNAANNAASTTSEAAAPAATTRPARSSNPDSAAAGGLGAAPGVAAQKLASTSSSLDPTLDESAMLRTESLVYSGTGRNIFSLVYTPPAAAIQLPTGVPNPRRTPPGPPPPPPPPPTCPPTCPPINLKFFGTAQRANNPRQAFLLQGEDVYLASQGDIVARKYKILQINLNSVQVEDLTNHNTQTLPLQQN